MISLCSNQITKALAVTILPFVILAESPSFAQEHGATAPMRGTANEIEEFCDNIADAARDQRYVLQRAELKKLQEDIDERVTRLKEKTEEYQDWLKRRNDFLTKAELGLVEIYKNMAADAAAAQLELVDLNLAAAIIMKLAPRQSSGVLTEMDPKRAAEITGIISSAIDPNTSKERS